MLFVVEMPDMPVQQDTIVIAQVQQEGQNSSDIDAHVGACILASNPIQFEASNILEPLASLQAYHQSVEDRYVPFSESDTVTILQQPQHGTLEPLSDREIAFIYNADTEYLGLDHATFLVEMGGKKFRIDTRINVGVGWPDFRAGGEVTSGVCPDGYFWKINETINESG